MNTKIIFQNSHARTRKADFYLGCFDGSVFLILQYRRRTVSVYVKFHLMDMVAVTSMVLPSLNVRDSKVFLTEMVEEELNQITITRWWRHSDEQRPLERRTSRLRTVA